MFLFFGKLCRIIDFYEGNEYIFIRDSANNKDVFISYVEKAIRNLYCFHYYHG